MYFEMLRIIAVHIQIIIFRMCKRGEQCTEFYPAAKYKGVCHKAYSSLYNYTIGNCQFQAYTKIFAKKGGGH